MRQPSSLAGQILLAMPGMGDLRFEKAVIAICAHGEDGALGVGIGNIRTNLRFRALLEQLDIDPGKAPDAPVHHGGPVEPGRGFVLHGADWRGDGSMDVPGIGILTSTLDVLKAIAAGEGPEQWVAALGYAGWSPGQLEEEMTRHGWFAVPGEAGLIFDTPHKERWAASYAKAGIDPALLTSDAGQA